MKFLRRFLIRLLNSATRRSADQRLRDEIAEHLALQIEENLRAGMPPAEARRLPDLAGLHLGTSTHQLSEWTGTEACDHAGFLRQRNEFRR